MSVDFNFASSGYTPPDGDALSFSFGAAFVEALEDVSLHVSVSYQALLDVLTKLDVSDGTFLVDAKTLLRLLAESLNDAPVGLSAYSQGLDDTKITAIVWAKLLRDAKISLEALGLGISDLQVLGCIGNMIARDLGLSLDAVSRTILNNLRLLLGVTDGAYLTDVTFALLAIPLSKPKRTSVYHRMSSVITRVT